MSVLIKFRLHEVAYMADIKKAFLQISLSERDCDAVRFLWFTGPPTEEKDERLQVLRMTRVVFGASPSPFLLAAMKQYESEHSQVAETISNSFYVDDSIASASEVSELWGVGHPFTKIHTCSRHNVLCCGCHDVGL